MKSLTELYYPAKYNKRINDFVYEHIKFLKPMKPGNMPMNSDNFSEPYSILWDWYPNRKNVEEPEPFVMLSPNSRLYEYFVRKPSPVNSPPQFPPQELNSPPHFSPERYNPPQKPSSITRKLHLELSDDDNNDEFLNDTNNDVPKFVHHPHLYHKELRNYFL